ncbi:MAG TPA: DegT/DnrJ/EryC1/StrS family aminotransferase [Candidatus Dormibacteraeota bacterium]|nr:DegT/DnrJ/EryC1/StrS family aminotransferase [Candidatus Dormibacteraeota bacterium]
METLKTIPVAAPQIADEEKRAVLAVLESGHLAQGPVVEAFEREFAAWCGASHAVAVNSGTAALHLLMVAHGVRPGDEVITSPFTFVSSANAALFVGARPVFVDIELETYCMDPARVEAAITPKTRSIMPVDLYGHPAAVAELSEIADRHRLVLIEDACQAHGASIGGKKAGALGVSASFSFYPTKNITTGEGGMITTDDEGVATQVGMLRQHGARERYHHDLLGYNFRMTDIAAAIGRAQLKKLDRWNEVRRRNASLLDEGLSGIRGVRTPRERPGYRHVYHQYTVFIEGDRDRFQARLRELGIGTAVHYAVPVHRQPLYLDMGYGDISMPNSENAAAHALSLPVHPALTESDLERVVEAVRKVAAAS